MKYYKKRKQYSLYDARVRYGSLCAKMESLTGLDGLDGSSNTDCRPVYRTMVWDLMRHEGFTCKAIGTVSGRSFATVRINTNAWQETLMENHPGWKREIGLYRRFVLDNLHVDEPKEMAADQLMEQFLPEAERERESVAGTPEDNFITGVRWAIKHIFYQ